MTSNDPSIPSDIIVNSLKNKTVPALLTLMKTLVSNYLVTKKILTEENKHDIHNERKRIRNNHRIAWAFLLHDMAEKYISTDIKLLDLAHLYSGMHMLMFNSVVQHYKKSLVRKLFCQSPVFSDFLFLVQNDLLTHNVLFWESACVDDEVGFAQMSRAMDCLKDLMQHPDFIVYKPCFLSAQKIFQEQAKGARFCEPIF